MRVLTMILALLTTGSSAFAFSPMSSVGIDLQSSELMMVCMDTVERNAVAFEKKHDLNECTPDNARIVPGSTKLTGLALDKKGFVYETYVESGCGNAVKLEVEVGPSKDGRSCRLLQNPAVLDHMN